MLPPPRSLLPTVLLLLAAAVPTRAQNVATYRYDNRQSGINAEESILSPSIVSNASFGKIIDVPIDGHAYAQPLYLSNLLVGGTRRNVAYVATMHDSVYAFDADTGATLWKTIFVSASAAAVPLVTTVPVADLPGSGASDVDGPEVGIESTPVIDEATGTLYVVAKTKETGRGDGNTHYVQRLHALDVATGAARPGGPQVIADTTCNSPLATAGPYDFNLTAVPQTPSAASTNTAADNYLGGRVYLNALRNLQRCSLTLAGGVVYVGWASHGDSRPYHGWLVGFDAATLLPVPRLVFCSTPNGWQGGIWQGGAGPTVDADGSILFSVANAGAAWCANQTPGNLGESFVRFDPAAGFSVNAEGFDFWAPGDAPGLGNADQGVGSGALVPIDVPGTIPRLAMGGSKNGKIYVLNRDNLGGYVAGSDRTVQTFAFNRGVFFGSPVFFNNCLFFDGNPIQGYTFNPQGSTFTASGSTDYGFSGRGAGLVISSNGTSNGIIWSFSSGVLKAVRPESIAGPGAASVVPRFFETPLGDRSTVKFTHPVVVNGKVYAANKTSFLAFGLLNATKPTVTVSASQPGAVAGQSAGAFTLTRAGSTLGNLRVTYALGGTAQNGTDYAALSGVATIPDGSASAVVAVSAPAGARSGTSVVLGVSANANYTVGTAAQAGVTISSAFDVWRAQNFGAQAGSPAAAPDADFDHDGVANGLEYAFGTDPAAAVPNAGPGYTVDAPDGARLRISFRRRTGTADGGLTIRVRAADELAGSPWSDLAVKTGGAAWTAAAGVAVTDDPNTGSVTVTDAPVAGGGARPRRFLRVTVELAGQ